MFKDLKPRVIEGDFVDVECRPVRHAEDIAFDAVRADRLRMIAKIAEQEKTIEALKARLGER